jgi:hypothetical protein
MELGHLLTRFGLTHPEVSSKLCGSYIFLAAIGRNVTCFQGAGMLVSIPDVSNLQQKQKFIFLLKNMS